MGRRTLLLIASVLVAAAGTALVWIYVRGADERARHDWQELVPVLVATKAIAVGANSASLADSTTLQQVPRKLVPDQAIGSADQVSGLITTVPILPGQYLIRAQFGSQPTAGIPDHRMGVSVQLEDPNRGAGLLHPDSHVAVYYVDLTSAKAKQAGGQTLMLLPDVRVLSVGNVTSGTDGGQGRIGTQEGVSTAVVTLDVVGQDATRLMLARQTGELYFALLGKDAKGHSSDDVTGSGLLPSGNG